MTASNPDEYRVGDDVDVVISEHKSYGFVVNICNSAGVGLINEGHILNSRGCRYLPQEGMMIQCRIIRADNNTHQYDLIPVDAIQYCFMNRDCAQLKVLKGESSPET